MFGFKNRMNCDMNHYLFYRRIFTLSKTHDSITLTTFKHFTTELPQIIARYVIQKFYFNSTIWVWFYILLYQPIADSWANLGYYFGETILNTFKTLWSVHFGVVVVELIANVEE